MSIEFKDNHNVAYMYEIFDQDDTEITFDMIWQEVIDFSDTCWNHELKDIPKHLRERAIYKMCLFVYSLGINSNYHPATYLDSMDSDDFEAIKAYALKAE